MERISTIWQGTLRDLRPIRFLKDIRSISATDYDLVISDYEPISAWSAKLEQVPSIALSHQASFLSDATPRPAERSASAEAILQLFAPADHAIGFHFDRYDDFIKPPIIRSAIRKAQVKRWNHITVYLPAYDHKVLQDIFAPFTQVDWHIFSPSCSYIFEEKHCLVHPLGYQSFIESFASCSGIICGAGFATCAEAMFLGKKMLTVPIENQYEQACNAAALREMGVVTLDTTLHDRSLALWNWLEDYETVTINEIADPKEVVNHLLIKGTEKDKAVAC